MRSPRTHRPRTDIVRSTLIFVLAAAICRGPARGDAPATQPAAPKPRITAKATAKTLAYELHRARPAGGAKAALVVWLHPAGGAMNDIVLKEYRQPLAKAGLALLIPTTTDPRRWSGADVNKVPATIEAAIRRDGGIDPEGVVLLGYSAGGQVAFALAARHADRFAGVATMSAYPLGNTPQGRRRLWIPPAGQKDRLRFFLIVGEQEGGRKFLRQVEAVYRARGFWVTLKEMPDAGHRYAAGLAKILVPWMASAAAGEKPADPMAKEREREMAGRKAAADRFIKRLDALAEQAPATQPAEPAERVQPAGPFHLALGPGWAQTVQAAGNKPAVWQFKKGKGAYAKVLATLAAAEFSARGGFGRYLGARYLTRALQGNYTAVHGKSRPEIAGRPAWQVVLSERRIGREPGATRLVERVTYLVELFLPTGRPTRFVGVAVQWRADGLSPEQAAGLVLGIQRRIRHVGGASTQPDDSSGAPDLRDILPPELLD